MLGNHGANRSYPGQCTNLPTKGIRGRTSIVCHCTVNRAYNETSGTCQDVGFEWGFECGVFLKKKSSHILMLVGMY